MKKEKNDHLVKLGDMFITYDYHGIRSVLEVVKLHGKKTITAIRLGFEHHNSEQHPELSGKHTPNYSQTIEQTHKNDIYEKVRLTTSGSNVIFDKGCEYGTISVDNQLKYNGGPIRCDCYYKTQN